MMIFKVLTFSILVGISAAELKKLGTVSGKTYYSENDLKDWKGARSYCKDNNMQLATIENEEEVDFLRNAFDKDNFQDWFWVDARGSQWDSFKWDSTGENVKIYQKLRWHPQGRTDGYEKCLVYSSFNDPNFKRDNQPAYYFPEKCYHVQRTLCQGREPAPPEYKGPEWYERRPSKPNHPVWHRPNSI